MHAVDVPRQADTIRPHFEAQRQHGMMSCGRWCVALSLIQHVFVLATWWCVETVSNLLLMLY